MPNTITTIKGETLKFGIYTPWNLTGYTVTSQLTDQVGNNVASFSITLATNPNTTLLGLINLTLSSTVTATLNHQNNYYSFDVKLVAPNAEVTKIPIVYITCYPSITP